MAELLDAEAVDRQYKHMQAEMRRVLASVRSMDDRTLWRFLKTLAYSASQHPQISAVPFDYESHFVIKHHDAGSG